MAKKKSLYKNLSYEELDDHGACHGGLVWVEKQFKDKKFTINQLLARLVATKQSDEWVVWVMETFRPVCEERVVDKAVQFLMGICSKGNRKHDILVGLAKYFWYVVDNGDMDCIVGAGYKLKLTEKQWKAVFRILYPE